MSDYIDRQAILKHIEKIRCDVQMMDDTRRASIIMNGMYLCEKAVRDQPSTQQPQRWIPVTERLPEHSGFYIVTAIVTDDGGKLVGLRWFSQEHGWKFGKNPLAWMPLPEPYEPQESEVKK